MSLLNSEEKTGEKRSSKSKRSNRRKIMERGKRKMSPKEIETGRRGKKRRRKKKGGGGGGGEDGNKN